MSRTLTARTPRLQKGGPGRPGMAAPRSLLRRFLTRPEVGSLLGAVAVFLLFFAVAAPFRQTAAMSTVLYQSSIIGIMAVAVALLMIGGEFDLSAGVQVVTSGLVASMFAFQLTLNVWAGAAAALAFSLGVGFVNGWLVTRTKIPSFLITLSMFMMLQGANIAVTKLVTGSVSTRSISNMDGFASAKALFAANVAIPPAFVRDWFGMQAPVISVKVTVLWWLLFVVLATWVLMRTRVGNWIYAVGGNADSARAVGVPVARVKIGLFMTVGFMAWFAGMHKLFEFNTVQSGEGVGQELLFIMAAVVGGCLLTGGYGTVIGAAIGALIYGMTRQGIVYAGWDNNWLMFFVGAMLLLATVVNAWVRVQGNKR